MKRALFPKMSDDLLVKLSQCDSKEEKIICLHVAGKTDYKLPISKSQRLKLKSFMKMTKFHQVLRKAGRKNLAIMF